MADGATDRPQSKPAFDDAVFTDAMTLSAGEEPQKQAEAQARANTLLLGAIGASDNMMFEKAVREKADVNFGGGKPLQVAAQGNNTFFMRLLVTQGADISHAVASLAKEVSGIPRTRKYDSYYDRTTYAYKSKDDERRYKQLNATMRVLADFEKTYLERIAPLEAVRLQKQVLDELRALKDEVTTAINGKPVDKPKLAAPAAFNPEKRKR